MVVGGEQHCGSEMWQGRCELFFPLSLYDLFLYYLVFILVLLKSLQTPNPGVMEGGAQKREKCKSSSGYIGL